MPRGAPHESEDFVGALWGPEAVPPLALHMVVAGQIANAVGHPLLDGQRGALFLGSTAPDIRVLLRWDRERTHFFKLEELAEQSGTRELFRAYPALAQPEKLSPATVAFVAGYVTHLEMDEVWIGQVYRPCFGRHSPLKGSLRANILDRLLQYELDRQRRADRQAMHRIVEALAQVPPEMEVWLAGREELESWRQVTAMSADMPLDWRPFRYAADRYLRGSGLESPEDYQAFLAAAPALLAEALAYVGPARLQAILERSVEAGLRALREYLGCS